jgi:DNA processing protein
MNYHLQRRLKPSIGRSGSKHYAPPCSISSIHLPDWLERSSRPGIAAKQLELLGSDASMRGVLYYAGDLDLARLRAVSIVGTRDVSEAGRLRASKLARELVRAGVVVVSGLARGVDEAAQSSAIQAGGSTIGVIGTPLDKAYPSENAPLQEKIYRDHLLISPFRVGEQVFRSNFPKRNRVMAAISDATVIVEASDASGTLHQAAECQRLKRWLFIMRSVIDDPVLTWPRRFIGQPRVAILNNTDELLVKIASP